MNPIRLLLQEILGFLGILFLVIPAFILMLVYESLSRMWGWIWKEDSQDVPTCEG